MQKTLSKSVMITGMGLHSGRQATLMVKPAPLGAGVFFIRTDKNNAKIEARYDNVTDTVLNTRLGGEISVSTIEHLMAAFAGMGITNAIVEIDGPEVPVLDGSSALFVKAFADAGIEEQGAPAPIFEVIKPVHFMDDKGAYAELLPYDGYKISFEIDFANTIIGHQSTAFEIKNGVFARELADCRTFCKREEVEYLQSIGLGLGGNLDNAVVIDGMQVLNPQGLRRADEAVRHKVLDAIGDLFLIGGFLRGHYHGVKAGHRMTNEVLRKAVKEGALVRREALATEFAHLPGFGHYTESLAY